VTARVATWGDLGFSLGHTYAPFIVCTSAGGARHSIYLHDHAIYARARERTMDFRAQGFTELLVSPDLMHMLVGCCRSADMRVAKLNCAPELPPNSIVAISTTRM
jgi:hypothetical protein